MDEQFSSSTHSPEVITISDSSDDEEYMSESAEYVILVPCHVYIVVVLGILMLTMLQEQITMDYSIPWKHRLVLLQNKA